ncbi:MAG: hypothetical protein AAFN59_04715 [Pseudomonadota bacterium]
MSIVSNVRDRLNKRSQYVQTLRELQTMDRTTMLDLNVYEGDFKRIAHEAVYGR